MKETLEDKLENILGFFNQYYDEETLENEYVRFLVEQIKDMRQGFEAITDCDYSYSEAFAIAKAYLKD